MALISLDDIFEYESLIKDMVEVIIDSYAINNTDEISRSPIVISQPTRRFFGTNDEYFDRMWRPLERMTGGTSEEDSGEYEIDSSDDSDDSCIVRQRVTKLTEEQFDLLETFVICDKVDLTCNICLASFDDDTNAVLLPCGHVYHPICVKTWLTTKKNTCPQCKNLVSVYKHYADTRSILQMNSLS